MRPHPLMSFDFLQIYALLRVSVEDPADEINDLWGQVDGELNLDFEDLVIGLVLISLGLERSLACAELVAEHPKAPDIGLLIIEFASNNFRWDIIERTTESLPLTKNKKSITR